jgi:hypothetical protein
MADSKIVLAAFAIAATGAGVLPTAVSAQTAAAAQCAETYRIVSEVKEDTALDALHKSLGKPAKSLEKTALQ